MKQHLGTGLLSWPSYERQSGRYGIIALFRPGQPDQGETGLQGLEWNVPIHDLTGTHGLLIAVLDDQEYDLGSGIFFTERDYATDYVGVKPDVPRDEEWLNVTSLYKVDGMITLKPIELYFESTAQEVA